MSTCVTIWFCCAEIRSFAFDCSNERINQLNGKTRQAPVGGVRFGARDGVPHAAVDGVDAAGAEAECGGVFGVDWGEQADDLPVFWDVEGAGVHGGIG